MRRHAAMNENDLSDDACLYLEPAAGPSESKLSALLLRCDPELLLGNHRPVRGGLGVAVVVKDTHQQALTLMQLKSHTTLRAASSSGI